jgi:hypothetical protein
MAFSFRGRPFLILYKLFSYIKRTLSLGELSVDVFSRTGKENYRRPLANTFGVKEWTLWYCQGFDR